MKRCPRNKDPDEFCPACYRAEQIVGLLDTIMAIRTDERPEDRWYWMCVRFARHWRKLLREHVARRRAAEVEQWDRIPDEKRFIPVRRDIGHMQGGFAYMPGGEDLDGAGGYGPALRAYEDRYDGKESW